MYGMKKKKDMMGYMGGGMVKKPKMMGYMGGGKIDGYMDGGMMMIVPVMKEHSNVKPGRITEDNVAGQGKSIKQLHSKITMADKACASL